MKKISGPSEIVSLTIANNTALSDAFEMSIFLGASVYVPATWTAANIGFKVSDSLSGTFDIALDKTGVPIQISNVNTGRAGWYSIPIELFANKFVKLWSKNTTAATETDINQGGARAMKIALK